MCYPPEEDPPTWLGRGLALFAAVCLLAAIVLAALVAAGVWR